MNDTIFGKIIRRELPANIVYEDDEVLGFKDIAPQAPVHVLFIPKAVHVPTLDDLTPDQAPLVGKLILAAAQYARNEGFAEKGYRVVMNCRDDAGQTVYHIHLHLLAGAQLGYFGVPGRRPLPADPAAALEKEPECSGSRSGKAAAHQPQRGPQPGPHQPGPQNGS